MPPAPELPDFIRPGLRVLVCGLNPSLYAAATGIPYGRPGNRFWPAALAAGLVTRDRDPQHALDVDGVGFTDMVKRPTAAASELHKGEYRDGVLRLDALVATYRPAVICFVGLTGWRAAIDKDAEPGPATFSNTPAYLMPSTSGLNASSQLPDHIAHLRRVVLMGSRG